ncbi:MAG: S46 family peptidase [bacterium]
MERAGLEIPVDEVFNPGGGNHKAVLLLGGGTGEFVSPDGLIMTNHHVAFGAVARIATAEEDYITDGCYAAAREEEIPARGYTARMVEYYRDVTGEILDDVEPDTDPAEREAAIAAARERARREGAPSRLVTSRPAGHLSFMELTELIRGLSRPSAYPHIDTEDVRVHQTHISVVFLAGDRAYKVKKPVETGFLDYTTLDQRLEYCRREVELNRRLAPGVYRGVVPIFEEEGLFVGEETLEETPPGGTQPPVEYAVCMERLPPHRTFKSLVRRGELGEELLDRLARLLAGFYEEAESGGRISTLGDWPTVARNCSENFDQSKPFLGVTLSERVLERLERLTDEALEELEGLIRRRAGEDVPRDGHGDLRLGHIYHLPERSEEELVVVDCIEFNERFRYQDPVADAAFLSMDLALEGREDLSERFEQAFLEAQEDEEGARLFPFYTAYRYVVRGKVQSMRSEQPELPEADRIRAVQKARHHYLRALDVLASPARRPALLLVGGLPGTGKSTLAEDLEGAWGGLLFRSDEVRKELAGLEPDQPASAPFGEGLYRPEHTRRTYEALLELAREGLFRGHRVVVDASFHRERWRSAFLDTARALGVPGRMIVCTVPAEEARRRLEEREEDASDADSSIHRRMEETWEEPAAETEEALLRIDTSPPPSRVREKTLEVLEEEELA